MKTQVLKATKEPSGHGEKYSRKSTDAIAALLTEPTIAAAARKAGVDEKTLRRWLRKPAFQQMYRDEQKHRMDAAIAGMDGATATVIETLVEMVKDRKGIYAKDRLRAGELVLNAYFKNKQLFLQFDERLSGERNVEADEEGESGDDTGESSNAFDDENTGDVSHEISVSSITSIASCPDETTRASDFHEHAEQGGESQPPEEDRAVLQTDDDETEQEKVVSDDALSTRPYLRFPQVPADDRESDMRPGAAHGADENETADSVPGTAEETVAPASQMGADFMEVLSHLYK